MVESTGGQARFITNAGGIVDFSPTSGPTGDGKVTAGSIEGAGNYFLGRNELTVGSNNLSTEVSGVISHGGQLILAGGSLVKVGTGTLTLSGVNNYSGATTGNDGSLIVNGSIAVSSGVTVNSGGLLGGTGIVSSTHHQQWRHPRARQFNRHPHGAGQPRALDAPPPT